MTFRTSMKLSLVLGALSALAMGDARAMIFTVPLAIVVVSAACLVHLAFFARN